MSVGDGPRTPESWEQDSEYGRADWEERMGWDVQRQQDDASTEDCASSEEAPAREEVEEAIDDTPTGPAHYPHPDYLPQGDRSGEALRLWGGQHHWGGDPLAMYVLERDPRHGIHSSAVVPTYIPMTCIVIRSWAKRGILTEVVEGMHGCCGGENLWLVAKGRYESLEECGARVGLERLGLSGLRFGREIGTACTTEHLIIRHIAVASYTDGGGISHTAIRPRERQTLQWLVLSGITWDYLWHPLGREPAPASISDVMSHVWEDITRFYAAGPAFSFPRF